MPSALAAAFSVYSGVLPSCRLTALPKLSRIGRSSRNRQTPLWSSASLRASPLAPEPFQMRPDWADLALPLTPAGVFDLKEIAAQRTAKIGPRFPAGDARTASKTPQSVQVVVHR